jgi:hypothetical protein
MDERRKVPRKKTDQFFGVYERETGEYIGRLVEMSTKGMSIHAVQPLDVNSIYEFKIDLPKPVAGRSEFCFEAECLRCNESNESSENYVLGFRITNIEFKELETIQYLLTDSLFYAEEDRPKITMSGKPV